MSINLVVPKKRFHADLKTDHPVQSMVGLKWDSQNYSCAYDAYFTVMYSIWAANPKLWTPIYSEMSTYMKLLMDGFHMFVRKQITLENARDSVRHQLHQHNASAFPYGTDGTDVAELAHIMINDAHVGSESLVICDSCSKVWRRSNARLSQITHIHGASNIETIRDIVDERSKKVLSELCEKCKQSMVAVSHFHTDPYIFVVVLTNTKVHINRSEWLNVGEKSVKFRLKGIVYFGGFHFTCLLFDRAMNCVYHDGAETGSDLVDIGNIDDIEDLGMYKNRVARLIIYSSEV